MRKRQKKKLEQRQREREERLQREAEEELRERTIRTVSFDEPTLQELEEIHTYHWTRFIPGTAIAVCSTLKRGGVFTHEGARLRAQLLEAAKK